MKGSPLQNTMSFSFKKVIFLSMALFSLSPWIAAHDADTGIKTAPWIAAHDADAGIKTTLWIAAHDADAIRTGGHLTCQCGEVTFNKSLDYATIEKITKMYSLFLVMPALFQIYSGTLNCDRCKIDHVSCKITKSGLPYCVTRTVSFKVFPKMKSATHKDYLKITSKGSDSIQKDPTAIHTPLGIQESNVNIIAERSIQSYPKIIDIPIGGLKYKRRHLREVSSCLYPLKPETSAIRCRIYPSSIKCVQKCAFGHTFKHGISRELHCNFKENKWIPSGFKECQPFVDCSVTLVSGGSSNCSSMSLTKRPECQIECLRYEDKEAVPEASYSCDINGKWTPNLPFCAVPKSDLVLANVPKKKTHNEIDE